MKKIAVTMIFLFAITVGVFANEPFFASQEGMTLTTANLNDRGRIERFTRMTINDVFGSDGSITIEYSMEILDRNRRPAGRAGVREFSVTVVDDILEVKLDNIMDLFMASRNMNYELSAGTFRIPSNMTVGSTIEDTWMNINVRVP
ncbi:MAG: hypothetical protein FWC97_11580, partial [Treponema sp.]|nr:hypothetical protein [Treponema sp.]